MNPKAFVRAAAGLVAGIALVPSWAQPAPDAHFRHITLKDGLPFEAVRAIARDRQGFLWIATEEGLCRYDGTSFVSFRYDRHDPRSIGNNFIADVIVDHAGMIWCATRNGVSRYDPVKEDFINFRSDADDSTTIISSGPVKLFADREDNIWVASWDGLCRIEKGSMHVKRFVERKGMPPLFSDRRVVSVMQDRAGGMWVGTLGGLDRLDPVTGHVEHIPIDCPLPPGAHGPLVIAIRETRDGMLWLGTWGSGLIRYDPATRASRCYLPQSERPNDGSTNVCTDLLESTYPGEQDLLWVASKSSGLMTFDRRSGTFTSFRATDPDAREFITRDVNCFFDDGQGNLFTGTGQGILQLSRNRLLFENITFTMLRSSDCLNNVFACYEDPYDEGRSLWIGTWTCGTYRYDRTSGALEPQQDLTRILRDGVPIPVHGFLRDARGVLYALVGNGLHQLDERTRRWSPVQARSGSGAPFDLGVPLDVKQGHDDTLVIGGPGGLVLFDPASGFAEQVRFDTLARQQRLHAPSDIQRVTGFIEHPKNIFWIIGPKEAVLRYDRTTGQLRIFQHDERDSTSLPENFRPKTIVLDHRGVAWSPTENGLVTFNTMAGEPVFRSLGTSENMPSEIFRDVVEDRSGKLWLSTHNGLVRFVPGTGGVRRFTTVDGLRLPDVGGIAIGAVTGTLFIMAEGTVQLLAPDRVADASAKGPVRLTGIQVLNREYAGGKAPFALDTIELHHDQNEFTFTFAMIAFTDVDPPSYRYQLEGFNSDWVDNGKRNSVSFMNLEGGTYRFHVRACSTDGTCTPDAILLTVIVHPPFWRTNWFYALCILLVTAGVMVYNRARLRTLTRQKLALETSVVERTIELQVQKERAERSERFKQQFLANMSHEIRTPMNAIMGMTGILKRNEQLPEQRKYLDAIAQSSENLLVILNDILDLSKLEAGKIDLEKVAFDPRQVIGNVRDVLRFKAEEKGIALMVNIAEDTPASLLGDPTRLNQIVLNLAGNAIKFTEHGSVTIAAQWSGGALSIAVTDTGIGIPHDRLDKIFEEFTQAYSDTSRKYGGTGLGLTISKRLAELQGGNITVHSEQGKGSTFTVSIPYSIAQADPVRGRHDAPQRTELRDLKILLAEDNDFNAMVAQDELADAIPGVQVDLAANGRIAVEMAQANDYDVILMDVQMPEMNGYDATRAIRALPGHKSRLPILAMTANVMKEEVERCMEAGMDGYVPKPFKREELMNALFQALGHPATRH